VTDIDALIGLARDFPPLRRLAGWARGGLGTRFPAGPLGYMLAGEKGGRAASPPAPAGGLGTRVRRERAKLA